jgi:diaminopimelate epimerase
LRTRLRGSKIRAVGLRFEKIEGLGNDFVVIDAIDVPFAELICDRHRGIGADGVLLVDPSAPSMRVINADGSRPEMCGNGIRCVVLSLALRGLVRVGDEVAIATDAGPHRCTLLSLEGDGARVRVAMRPYSIEPDPKLVTTSSPMIDSPVAIGEARIVGTFVSMGNPHFVAFDAEKQGVAAHVREIQEHTLFPARINVGLAEQIGDRAIALRVFERGVGYTEACGTGACAAAAAAVETNRIARGVPIEVRLPGGVLEIVIGERGAPVLMTGPARRVYRGEMP